MLLPIIGGLLAAAGISHALKGAPPFFLLSTEPIDRDALHSLQIATASGIEDGLHKALDSCDASRYIFIEQGGVQSSDLRDASVLPQLQRRMSQDQYKSVIQISEVLGNVDVGRVVEQINKACNKEDRVPAISRLRFPVILDSETAKGRKALLDDTDISLAKELTAQLSNHTSHVLIFTSKSAAAAMAEEDFVIPQHVEMDEPPFQGDMHTDLKRDVEYGSRRRRQTASDDDFQKGLGLFERYQFFSPGIFMGLTVSLLLITILYVGITAISGLEVSYMAFSKEMGPQAQKKQQ